MRVEEKRLYLECKEIDYIKFGSGTKTLVMIQGLNTQRIHGNGLMLSILYKKFAKEYTVYLFDRRERIYDGITVKEMALDNGYDIYAEVIKQTNAITFPLYFMHFQILIQSCFFFGC